MARSAAPRTAVASGRLGSLAICFFSVTNVLPSSRKTRGSPPGFAWAAIGRESKKLNAALNRYFIRVSLPIMQGSIELAIHRQIGPPIRKLCCQAFIHLNSQTGLVSRVHPSVFEVIGVRENFVSFRR